MQKVKYLNRMTNVIEPLFKAALIGKVGNEIADNADK